MVTAAVASTRPASTRPASTTPCTPRDRVIRSPGCDGPIATATAARAATLGPRAPRRHRGAVRYRSAKSHYRTTPLRIRLLRCPNQAFALSKHDPVNGTSIAFVAAVGPLFLLSTLYSLVPAVCQLPPISSSPPPVY